MGVVGVFGWKITRKNLGDRVDVFLEDVCGCPWAEGGTECGRQDLRRDKRSHAKNLFRWDIIQLLRPAAQSFDTQSFSH